MKCPISIIGFSTSIISLTIFLTRRHVLRILILGTTGLGLLTYLTLVLVLKYCLAN